MILEGTNADDLNGYRPGFLAVRELGIHSPLVQFGLTKEEVRAWAEELGLSVSNRPAMPCLATRFPYGTTLSYGEMRKAEQGEEYLRGLGLYNVRLRIYGDLVRYRGGSGSIFHIGSAEAGDSPNVKNDRIPVYHA